MNITTEEIEETKKYIESYTNVCGMKLPAELIMKVMIISHTCFWKKEHKKYKAYYAAYPEVFDEFEQDLLKRGEEAVEEVYEKADSFKLTQKHTN